MLAAFFQTTTAKSQFLSFPVLRRPFFSDYALA
jgi:hypothetical protein